MVSKWGGMAVFGYVSADSALLGEEDMKLYRSVYCGLCHALSQRHGAFARMTLNYDMAFLALLLSSVYGVGFEKSGRICMPHPAKKQDVSSNEIIDYAADMNIMLSYKNVRDDWEDDRNPLSLAASGIMSASYVRLSAKYPRQYCAIENCLSRLSEIEKNGDPSPDSAADAFGKLLAEIFIWQTDALSDKLRAFGYSLGRAVYIMDAAVDLKKDLKKQRYNPLAFFSGDREELICVLMDQCTKAYEALGVREYKSIFDNILYSGIWTKYRLMNSKEAGRRGKGSV